MTNELSGHHVPSRWVRWCKDHPAWHLLTFSLLIAGSVTALVAGLTPDPVVEPWRIGLMAAFIVAFATAAVEGGFFVDLRLRSPMSRIYAALHFASFYAALMMLMSWPSEAVAARYLMWLGIGAAIGLLLVLWTSERDEARLRAMEDQYGPALLTSSQGGFSRGLYLIWPVIAPELLAFVLSESKSDPSWAMFQLCLLPFICRPAEFTNAHWRPVFAVVLITMVGALAAYITAPAV